MAITGNILCTKTFDVLGGVAQCIVVCEASALFPFYEGGALGLQEKKKIVEFSLYCNDITTDPTTAIV